MGVNPVPFIFLNSFNLKCSECGIVLKLTDEQNLYADVLEIKLIKPVKATKRAETNTNQLDCFAVNNCCIPNNILDKIGHTFICERKNENKAPANGYFTI